MLVGEKAKHRCHIGVIRIMQTCGSEMAPDYQRRPITVDEYERMAKTGIIGPAERVELIEGEIVLMPPMGPPHFSSVGRLNRLFVTRLGELAVVMPQAPLRLPPISEPEPDFAIYLPRDDFYLNERAGAEHAYAVIECSDSSLRYDRKTKLRVYAKAGVREYWIVNLLDRCVEIHRGPHELGYRLREVKRHGEALAFERFPDIVFTVDEVLGPMPG
ncbi:MAG: Uma2 family endonuclease [Candidatus Eremiobacteraeota bacterium]|nr:Uma2 family endonuclease [Candidatus Eremiobacteraeota bacterium]MBC5804355.1 Uma2 family endonuclease [Candidatus Eremiobacteraeota bacterium]MBC5822776.1 Uma2 family endonuclease [Candidatus Eremiobacteraeota bacterium]